MADPMRVRAQETGGIVDVKVLMKHDMETGQRKDSSSCKGKQVFHGEFGPAVSKDPFLNFKFKGGAKGDEVTVSWVDNKNDTRTDKAKIS
jgi:sulfur-oxidizing protein SoxZ